jgi:chemotaxis protein MotB
VAGAKRDRETPIIVVRKVVAHGHHGGAWKVALADFMTAMFALFLVLWLVNQSSDVKSAIAGYFQDPLGRADEYGSSIVPGEGAQAQVPRPMSPSQIIDLRIDRLQRLAERLRDRLGKLPQFDSLRQFVEITITDEGLRVELLEDSTGTFFESGSALPNPRGRTLLQLIGQELAGEPNRVAIEGHTDARPFARTSGYSNWELSADRANTARRIVGEAGVGSDRFDEVRALAERRPKYPDAPFDPRNRRVAILVVLDRTVEGKVVPVDSVARTDRGR